MTLTWKYLPTYQTSEMIANNNNYKISKNKHRTNEDINNQIHSQTKIHDKHLKNINKIDKYKKLNMTEQKADMKITKTDKYKTNLSNTSMTKHKTDMNITKFVKYKKLNMTERKADVNITKIDIYKPLS